MFRDNADTLRHFGSGVKGVHPVRLAWRAEQNHTPVSGTSRMSFVNLDPTYRLHQELIDRWREDRSGFGGAWSEANRQLQTRGIRFESSRTLPVALTALVFRPEDISTFRRITETLHAVVERALDWVLESPDRLERYFADHRRIFPYLAKTRGLPTWQGYSRYDAVLTREGRVKIIELNTACPAGFLHAECFSQVIGTAIASAGVSSHESRQPFGTIPSGALCDELLSIE